MFKISKLKLILILKKLISLLGTKLLKITSGSESEEILKVSIIGDRYWGILFPVNINSGSGIFSKFSGTDSILVFFSFSKLYESLFLYSLAFFRLCMYVWLMKKVFITTINIYFILCFWILFSNIISKSICR